MMIHPCVSSLFLSIRIHSPIVVFSPSTLMCAADAKKKFFVRETRTEKNQKDICRKVIAAEIQQHSFSHPPVTSCSFCQWSNQPSRLEPHRMPRHNQSPSLFLWTRRHDRMDVQSTTSHKKKRQQRQTS